jgi:hypothetical protein
MPSAVYSGAAAAGAQSGTTPTPSSADVQRFMFAGKLSARPTKTLLSFSAFRALGATAAARAIDVPPLPPGVVVVPRFLSEEEQRMLIAVADRVHGDAPFYQVRRCTTFRAWSSG